MAQLAQRLGLDLADTLAGYVELLADLLEGAGTAVLDAEAQAQSTFSSRGVSVSSTLNELLLEQREGGSLRRVAARRRPG